MDVLDPALSTLIRAYTEGCLVHLKRDGKPFVTGNEPSQELLEMLKVNREGVITLLEEHRIGEIDHVMRQPRRYVYAQDCLARNACSTLGPCSRVLMKQSCKVVAKGVENG